MMLDPKKITEKAAEAIGNAIEIAKENGHQQISPLHLGIALFEDVQGTSML